MSYNSCVCHEGSVCTDGCAGGLHHTGCPNDHGQHSFADCGYQRPHRGLAALDSTGLSELRAIILTVIDDGDPLRAEFAKSLRHWHFDHDPCDGVTGFTEADANEQRLRFCDAIQQAIVARTTPAVRGE